MQKASLHPFFAAFPPFHPSATFRGVGRAAQVHRGNGGCTLVQRAAGLKHMARCLSGCIAHVASLMLQLGRGSKNNRRKRGGKWFTAGRGLGPGTASAHPWLPVLDVTRVSKSRVPVADAQGGDRGDCFFPLQRGLGIPLLFVQPEEPSRALL